MKYEKIFVTVGTTEFNNLVRKLNEKEVYQILRSHLGCKKLKIQIGQGEKVDFNYPHIKVEMFTLKDSIAKEIDEADLVSNCVLIIYS
jgi:beta-1,4-N-acetylglucosaminyltransferase